jgi:dUTP pyrophosphatase
VPHLSRRLRLSLLWFDAVARQLEGTRERQGFVPTNESLRASVHSPGVAELCYLALPFNSGQPDAVVSKARVMLTNFLNVAGYSVFSPSGGWSLCRDEPEPKMGAINRLALSHADVFVGVVFGDIVSVGVPMEIDRALSLGLPTVVLGVEGADRSTALRACGAKVFNAGTRRSIAKEGLLHLPEMVSWLREERTSRASPNVLRVTGDGLLPSRAYPDDAGFDLAISQPVTIGVDCYVSVPCRLQFQLPPDTWGLLLGRSSALFKHKLQVFPGVIDGGYRGDVAIALHNVGDAMVRLEAGTRIAQLIVLPNLSAHTVVERVAELSPTQRGEGGFGSTG